MKEHFEQAIKNIISYGDTDIFPFPIENHIIFDLQEPTLQLLLQIHGNFDQFLVDNPPVNNNSLSPVGYTGFRWATQIDPIWNAYFLGLVTSLGERIEAARLPLKERRIFSYRFKPDAGSGRMFDPQVGWPEFQERSIELAQNYNYVLICDIADFYSRIYHHRLENSLTQLKAGNDTHKRIMRLLQMFSNTTSYGLPIGGPAARLLAELLLNRTDRLLKDHGIEFCRFADDYHIFSNTKEDAYQKLTTVSEKLFRNEGLSLQKAKTRIMSSKEFVSASDFNIESNIALADPADIEARAFLKISLKYDPYSRTAVEDYEVLRQEVERFDILGMLARELAKTRVHSALTKKLIAAIRYLPPKVKNDAIESLINNLDVLSPLYSIVMIIVKEVYFELDPAIRESVSDKLKALIHQKSHLLQVDVNLAFTLRVLGLEYSDDKEVLFAQIFHSYPSDAIKRDVILMMASWHATHWVSDVKNYYRSLSVWEKRAFLVASYSLGDEGSHWRDHTKKEFSAIDILYRDWAAKKVTASGELKIAL